MSFTKTFSFIALGLFGQAGLCTAAFGNVAVEPPFASHMVLQRDMKNPVWGTASNGEEVSVSIGEQTKTATAAADGSWRVELDPLDAGGPMTMTIQGNNTVTLSDVYVGEVWQAAGQSNMDTRLSFYPDLSSEISAADHPLMRYFTVRQPGNPPTTWEVVSPTTAGDLSALGYFFAKEIQQRTGLAVGLVVTAVGGTTIASWLDPATLSANPSITDADRGTMWDEWVSPVVGYGIRGTIWIQGEQNTNSTDAPGYGDVFRLLINGWRAAWGQGQFPFYYGQLSNIHDLQTDPNNVSNVAEVREGQRMALVVPNTAMSVNMDIGSASDWHFPNKAEAGRRLALPARALIYGEPELVYSGPLYLTKTINNGQVTLYFDHVGSGLVSQNGGALSGFAIAGSGGDWVWGNAEIQGETVVVSSASVPNPTRVRYAWGDNPILSLFNQDGLPASSFTTESEDLEPSGTGGAGGSSGSGGDSGSSPGGVPNAGGEAGQTSGGTFAGGAAGASSGGALLGGAGTTSTGGSAGAVVTSGGALGSGGVSVGGGGSFAGGASGTPSTGGEIAQSEGGMSGASHQSGAAGLDAGLGGSAAAEAGSEDQTSRTSDSGCGCRSAGGRASHPPLTGLILFGLLLLGRRRESRSGTDSSPP